MTKIIARHNSRYGCATTLELPEAASQELGIHPDNKFKSFVESNHYVTLIPQKSGAAKGILKGLKLQKKRKPIKTRPTFPGNTSSSIPIAKKLVENSPKTAHLQFVQRSHSTVTVTPFNTTGSLLPFTPVREEASLSSACMYHSLAFLFSTRASQL